MGTRLSWTLRTMFLCSMRRRPHQHRRQTDLQRAGSHPRLAATTTSPRPPSTMGTSSEPQSGALPEGFDFDVPDMLGSKSPEDAVSAEDDETRQWITRWRVGDPSALRRPRNGGSCRLGKLPGILQERGTRLPCSRPGPCDNVDRMPPRDFQVGERRHDGFHALRWARRQHRSAVHGRER